MPKTLLVGVVGCGRVAAERHLPALTRLPGARVAALADVDSQRLQRIADHFQISDRHAGVADLLAKTQVDVIAVCVPVEFHAEVALAALEAGKHVLIEKPLAADLDQADRIALRAQESGCKVLMGFNFRWHRLLRQAKELIRRGDVGQVESIRAVFASAHDKPPGWQTRRESGGGALFDQAVHVFDLWRFLLDCEVEEVFAHSRSGAWEDETVTVNARLTGGVLASVMCSERAGENNDVEIYGRKGQVKVSCYRFDGLVYSPQGNLPGTGRERVGALVRTVRELPVGLAQLRYGGDVLASYREEWRHFLGAICDDSPVHCTVDDGRRALAVILGAMASASSGRAVQLAECPRKVTPVSARQL